MPEFEPSTFYWTKYCGFCDDGTLEMKATGYEQEDGDLAHWTGYIEIPPDHQDYLFWNWVIQQKGRFKSLLSDEDVVAIRREYTSAQGNWHGASDCP